MPYQPDVTIAIPVCQKRISPVLDTASRILLVTRKRGKAIGRREIILAPAPADRLAANMADLHVDVLLCAALSESLWQSLERQGVRVRPHVCGEIEEVLQAFDAGQLHRAEFRMPGCWGLHWHNQCCRRRPVAALSTAPAQKGRFSAA